MKIFQSSAIILASITAILYAAQSAYISGVLSVFGIPPDIFSYNFQDTLYKGFILFLKKSTSVIIGIVIGYIISIPILVWLDICVSKKIEAIDKNKINIIKRIISVLNDIKLLFPIIISCLYIIFILFIILKFQNIGKEFSKEFINDIRNKNDRKLEMTNINIDNDRKKVYVILCDNYFCAGLNDKKDKIMYFKKEQLSSFPISR